MRDFLFATFLVACLAALTWPGYDWLGNRIEPRVLGLPFSLAWVAGWVVLSFVAITLYHVTGRDDRRAPAAPGEEG